MSKGLAAITGASSGIGAAFARKLAAEGYDLLLIARRLDRLEALAAEFGTGEALAADLVNDKDLRRVEERLATSASLSMLVNNAGFGIAGRFFDTDVEDHDRMHRLHVMATMRLTHAALRRMVPANHGAVINVASVAGFTISPGSVSYSATKNWMNVFTEGLWLDLKTRRSKVRVQALCPGFTYSEFHDVMPMDRSVIPASWWTRADEVVDASLKGLERDKLFVIPGWRYKLAAGLLRVAPRSAVRAWSAQFARRLKRTPR
jgi:short-subunit dehydrogenase